MQARRAKRRAVDDDVQEAAFDELLAHGVCTSAAADRRGLIARDAESKFVRLRAQRRRCVQLESEFESHEALEHIVCSIAALRAVETRVWRADARHQCTPRCTLVSLERGAKFRDIDTREQYAAAGEMYACVETGHVHCCGAECDRRELAPRDECVHCTVTGAVFGKVVSTHMWGGRADTINHDNCGVTAVVVADDASRARNDAFSEFFGARTLRLTQAHDVRRAGRRARRGTAASRGVSARIAGAPHITQWMMGDWTRFAESVCHKMIYGGAAVDLALEHMLNAEAGAQHAVLDYLRECARTGRARARWRVLELHAAHNVHVYREHMPRAVCETTDLAAVAYFSRAVVRLWCIVSGTPAAAQRRNAAPNSFRKCALALLYLLHAGIAVDVRVSLATPGLLVHTRHADADADGATRTEAVVFVPPHAYLKCIMPARDVKRAFGPHAPTGRADVRGGARRRTGRRGTHTPASMREARAERARAADVASERGTIRTSTTSARRAGTSVDTHTAPRRLAGKRRSANRLGDHSVMAGCKFVKLCILSAVERAHTVRDLDLFKLTTYVRARYTDA